MIKEAMAILDKVADAITPSALEHPMSPALVSGCYDWKTQKGSDVYAFGTSGQTTSSTASSFGGMQTTKTDFDSWTD